VLSKLLLIAVLVLLAAAIAVAGAILLNRVPLTEEPGLLQRLRVYLGDNRVQTSRDSPFLERRSIRLRVSPGEFLRRSGDLIEAAGWQRHPDHDDGLHWVVTSSLLRFKDDVVLELSGSDLGVSWLDVDARSRLGKGDLGANTRHLMQLRRMLVEAGLAEPTQR
jgi:hypothetical protein